MPVVVDETKLETKHGRYTAASVAKALNIRGTQLRQLARGAGVEIKVIPGFHHHLINEGDFPKLRALFVEGVAAKAASDDAPKRPRNPAKSAAGRRRRTELESQHTANPAKRARSAS